MTQNADAPNRKTDQCAGPRPLLIVVHRFVLFLVWQATIAALFALRGAAHPWQASIAWWPVSVTLTNLISIVSLRFLTNREGLSWSQFIGADFGREHLRRDLLTLLVLLLVSGPIAMLPNYGLATRLFGDLNTAVGLFVLPLPRGVALACLVLFPLTIALAELPTYFGYVMPRLQARWGHANWWAVLVPAFWLGAQHMAVPFILDGRFILYRLVMFLPFALLLGFTLRWRGRLLPYLMVIHALMDLAMALQVWQVSA